CQEYLKIATFEDRLLLLNHIQRCPAGSSPQLARLIDIPSPLPYRTTNVEYGQRLVNYAVTVIATILSPILEREKFIGGSSRLIQQQQPKNSPSTSKAVDVLDPWCLIDVDYE